MPTDAIDPRRLPALFLAGAALVALGFFIAYTGVLTSVPQDEGAYVFDAQAVADAGVVGYLRGLPLPRPDEPVDPAVLIHTRVLANTLLSVPLWVVPPSLDVFWPLGTLVLLAAHLCCAWLFSRRGHPVAAIAVASVGFLNPALLLSAGRALPDAAMVACLMVAFAAVSPGRGERCLSGRRVALSGAAMALAILIKEGAAVLFPVLVAIVVTVSSRRRVRHLVMVVALVSVLVLCGYVVIWFASGGRLWTPAIIQGAHAFKFERETPLAVPVASTILVRVLARPGYPWLYHATNAVWAHGSSLASMCYATVLPVLALGAALVVRRSQRIGLGGLGAIIGPVVLAWLLIEWGPAHLGWRDGRFEYGLIFKEADSFKFAIFLAPPLLVALHQWQQRVSFGAATIVTMGVLAMVSMGAAGFARRDLVAPVAAAISQRGAIEAWLDADRRHIVVSDSYTSLILDLSLSRRYQDRFVTLGNFLRAREVHVTERRRVLYIRNAKTPVDLASNFEAPLRAEFLAAAGRPSSEGIDYVIFDLGQR